jgi:signal transduction histidine kinase
MSRLETLNTVTTRKPLRVLMVEDSETDALLLKRALDRGGFATTTARVWTAEDMDRELSKEDWDVILADHTMPGFSAPEALDVLKKHQLDIPFIIVSGHIEEYTAVAAMNAGAHDYIMKDQLARLVPVIERELREAEVRRALHRAHMELETRVEQRTADLKAANRKLHRMLEERRQLENELLEIAENERRRIGFDLHDDLGQKLTGASMMVKALEHKLSTQKHPSTTDAARIHELIDQIIHHTHNLAHEFGSMAATGDDVCTVLKTLTENVRKMFNIQCEFTSSGSIPELPHNTCVQLYKIAQEAVSNAIKHGKAGHVKITLQSRGHELTLMIRNDGMPFSEPAAAKDRMGLKIMNYRASTINGSIDFKPQEEGTLVTCALAIQNGGSETTPAEPKPRGRHKAPVSEASKL